MQIQNMVTDVDDIFNSLLSDDVEEMYNEEEIDEPMDEDDDDTDDQPDNTVIDTANSAPATTAPKKRGRPKSVHKLAVEVKNSIANLPYTHKLGDVQFNEDDMYTINEFGKMDVIYKRVRNPINELTDYYSSHCQVKTQLDKQGNPVYETSNQLSKHYIAIHMESLIEDIKSGITFDNELVYVEPFICTWRADTKKTLTTIDSELEKDLFMIYSGFDSTKIFNVKDTKIELYVSNSYDGKSAILSNFVINMIGEDSNGNQRIVRDFFSIRDMKNKFLHKGIQISDIQATLSNIDLNINNDIQVMKNIKMTPEEINEIATKFQKSKAKQIRQRFESMPDKYKNMYFSLLIVSSILSDDYKASEHFNVQPIVNKIVKRAVDKYNRKLAAAQATV